MPYREVIRAKKFGGRLAGHARQHAHRVATSAAAPFRDRLPPDREFPDIHEYQLWVGEEADRMRDQVIVIDDRHAEQRQRAHKLREQRDEWVRKLRPKLVTVKNTAEGSYGPGASREIFQEDPQLPADPVALHQLAQRAYQTLTDPEFALVSVQPGVMVNPAVLAESFAEPLNGLEAVLTQLDDTESEIKHTQSEKDEHLEELETYNRNVVRFYEAFFVLAGHPRLAKRLRPSSHVRSETGDPDSGPPPAEDGEAAAAAGDVPPMASNEADEEATA
jgi:hypothetical protein